MNYILISLLVLLLVPSIYFYVRTITANRFIIDRNVKEELDVLAKAALKERNMTHFAPQEFRDVRVTKREDGGKNLEIDTYVVDVKDQSIKWTHVGKMVRIVAIIDKNDRVMHLDVKDEHTKDTGQLIPEDTNSISNYSATLPNVLREYIGQRLFDEEMGPVPEADLLVCDPKGAFNSDMCKDSVKVRTEVPFKPTTVKYTDQYSQLNNEFYTGKDPVGEKYQCTLVKPYFSALGTTRQMDRLVCKERYDLDDNPWIARPQKELREDLGGLEYSESNQEEAYESV